MAPLYPTTPEDIASLSRRFWKKVRKTDGCWVWTASIGSHGYGQIRLTSVQGPLGAGTSHRVSWFLHYGVIPNDLHICHRCDNRMCVRPDHLFLGTHHDNMLDKQSKGRCRTNPRKGCNNPGAKFTPDQIAYIRLECKPGMFKAFARRYGVDPATISNIVRRRHYSDI